MSHSASCKARVLFDTDSHRTFITKQLFDTLRLKPFKKEVLNVNTFGWIQSERHGYEVVSFTLSSTEENVEVRVLVTNKICPHMPLEPVYNLTDHPELL